MTIVLKVRSTCRPHTCFVCLAASTRPDGQTSRGRRKQSRKERRSAARLESRAAASAQPATGESTHKAVGGVGGSQSDMAAPGPSTTDQRGQTARSRLPPPDAPDVPGEALWEAMGTVATDTGEQMLGQDAKNAAAKATNGTAPAPEDITNKPLQPGDIVRARRDADAGQYECAKVIARQPSANSSYYDVYQRRLFYNLNWGTPTSALDNAEGGAVGSGDTTTPATPTGILGRTGARPGMRLPTLRATKEILFCRQSTTNTSPSSKLTSIRNEEKRLEIMPSKRSPCGSLNSTLTRSPTNSITPPIVYSLHVERRWRGLWTTSQGARRTPATSGRRHAVAAVVPSWWPRADRGAARARRRGRRVK